MRGAWYVIEVYCVLSIYRAYHNISADRNESMFLALTLLSLLVTFILVYFTFKGKRLASRILSVLIIANAASYVWYFAIEPHAFNIYIVYMLIVMAYLIIGAIKLWRIKELPTRFTDPPAHT
jgi:hypothetical protein